MEELKDFLNLSIHFSKDIVISVQDIIVLVVVLFIATIVLRLINKFITRNLPLPNKKKFNTVFSYGRYLIYVIILFIMLHSFGVPVTGVFAASAALLLGIGLALQTLFQDIISGVFILVDQTVHVGDIIELDGKIGRVDEIKLRTTRATTADNKVLVIPNHFYLTNSLYNWTQNGATTRENVTVGVAYGSDVQLVKKILLEVARNHPAVLETPEPAVLFTDFGESSLNFKVAFTINDSFNARFPQSDMRFEIDRLFREHKISIPFPQRDIHIISGSSEINS
ncbi:mechanosensitive ion channel-like protein [Gelidibacter sediminis]|uniref:Mechanosensitive ion channel-like protein n=1 Tax=Gelidibacter sediminis TaxID=1608710 RepID=A0A4R7Q6Y3_9FLAO|nr:mechanosensitive ion channel domain-containing protein [Gelidibacter sediminis]TDU42682.1 mechanosensitive ion channel-like protein [Gelidibacter sediminis]